MLRRGLVAASGGERRWRVLVELAGADGTVEVHEVGVGERPLSGHAVAERWARHPFRAAA